MYKYILLTLAVLALLHGCDIKNTLRDKSISTDLTLQDRYVTREKFKIGRVCTEVTFNCLRESTYKSWQDLTPNGKLEFFVITKKVKKRFKEVVKQWNIKYEENNMNPYIIGKKDKEFYDKVEAKKFLNEMEKNLEKEFPGFWRNVKTPIRHRWLQRAISKANKYGYTQRDNIQIIELCARIGIDFDSDPKWNTITHFITMPNASLRGYAGDAVEYLDFTIFEKDYSLGGDKITSWSMKTALQYLPKPKREVPSLDK